MEKENKRHLKRMQLTRKQVTNILERIESAEPGRASDRANKFTARVNGIKHQVRTMGR